LKALARLRKLDLYKTHVHDAGLAHLSGLNQLQHLHLQGARITDAGLPHLSKLTHLEFLSLDGTHITDAGLPSLKALTRLKHLDVNTKVTAAGSTRLKKDLPMAEIDRRPWFDPGQSEFESAIYAQPR
jgi:Leucine-rich repeat (LRR) protein